jgi:hypothetical protein
VSTLVVKIVVVGTEWIVGGPYPKTFVEAVVVEVERTNEELLRDESAIELLLINDRFGGTLTFVGEAIPKQEHALDSFWGFIHVRCCPRLVLPTLSVDLPSCNLLIVPNCRYTPCCPEAVQRALRVQPIDIF